MKRICSIAACSLVLLGAAQAEFTNAYPKSNLELFEERTGVIMIHATEEIGVAPGKNGGISVKCREARDPDANRREYGLAITVTQGDNAEDTTMVDYDELDALIRAVDYVGRIDWSVTSLNHFEVAYVTRSGLRVTAYSSRRGLIEAVVTSNRLVRSRCFMTMGQLAQLRTHLDQAKAKIELIMKDK